jgi:hypothetical protein
MLEQIAHHSHGQIKLLNFLASAIKKAPLSSALILW